MIKILLVDDEPDILNFLSYNLTKEGFDVKTAHNGERTIDVHILKIREKIGEEYIKTIKGIGYKFHF